MARNYVPLKQIVNDFMISLDGADYASHASDAAIRNFALRGLRELGFDMLKVIRSLKLSVSSNNTVTLPDDYVDWSKVGVVGGDGLVYVLGENKNINYSQKYSTSSNTTYDADGDGLLDREDDKSVQTDGVTRSDDPPTFGVASGVVDTYNSSTSRDFELPEHYTMELVAEIASLIGVNLRDQQVTSFAAAEQAERQSEHSF